VSDEERASALRAGLSDSDDWSNRAVVVTGASGGIGKGIVGALLEVGAKVILSDIDSDELAAELRPSRSRASAWLFSWLTSAKSPTYMPSMSTRSNGLANSTAGSTTRGQ
jgi:hypothetical protein